MTVFLQQEVCHVKRVGAHFEVATTTGTSYQARSLIAATGPFRQPHIPVFPGQEHFQGQIFHTASYRHSEPLRGQRVLVVGAGNSAVQIAVELAQVAQVTLTSRQPVRFLPQRPWGRDVHWWMWLSGVDRLAWPSLWQRLQSNSVLDAGRYQAALAASRPDWRRLAPEGVMWADGQAEAVHTILLATGYRFQQDYLAGLPVLDTQARRFGAELVPEDVLAVDFGQAPFTVRTDADEYMARAVIIATGASARWLDLPSEQRFLGRGISVCATCDGFFFRSKDVVVVGGGDTAMEEALFLTRYARQVTLLHRRATFRASAILLEQVQSHPKIRVLRESEVVDLLGEETVAGVRVRHTATGEEQMLPAQGVFLAIGHHPNTELFQGWLHLDPAGYILPSTRTMTTVAEVFAAGDVADSHYRQAITVAADGARAAIDVRRWLEQQSIAQSVLAATALLEARASICC